MIVWSAASITLAAARKYAASPSLGSASNDAMTGPPSTRRKTTPALVAVSHGKDDFHRSLSVAGGEFGPKHVGSVENALQLEVAVKHGSTELVAQPAP